MDWQTVLTIAGIVAFVWLMMRGCGGMSAGGCGTGGCGMHRHPGRSDKEQSESETQ